MLLWSATVMLMTVLLPRPSIGWSPSVGRLAALLLTPRPLGRSTSRSRTALAAAARVLPFSLDLSAIERSTPLAKRAMEFLDASPDPFHAVQTSADMLLQAGFTEIDPQDSAVHCRLLPGGKYFFTRNRSTLVAFAVGKKFQPGHGFKIIGAHTDSPNLKIKARSKRSPVGAANCIQLAVECYGGGLWHTWFDRDLSVAGRVFLLQQEQASSHATIQQRLIKIDRPILRIPNLAIHLQSTQEREAFSPNKEDHLLPILAMQVEKALAAPLTSNNATNSTTTTTNSEHLSDDKDGWTEHQEPILLHLLAKELHVKVSDIVDFELNLFDTQKASLGGAFSEFVHSARLDNLASCFMAVQSLIDYSDKQDDCNNLEQDEDISLIALFDHEEVGSSSATGAGSPIIKEAVELISSNLASTMNTNSPQPSSASLYASAARKSFILSVDQAHALHPNYANKHEKGHAPRMNDGMVIKRNNNQRYATNALTALIIREIARRAQLPPVQEFVVRNDCPCGSTIGPILSSQTGIRAIDMGCPQLSMHSIRETMGTCDCTFYMD